MAAPRTILAATTNAAQSSTFVVGRSSRPAETNPVSIIPTVELAGSEEAALQVSPDQGSTWFDVLDREGAVKLTASINMIVVSAPGLYRVDKDATAAATGLVLASPGNPGDAA